MLASPCPVPAVAFLDRLLLFASCLLRVWLSFLQIHPFIVLSSPVRKVSPIPSPSTLPLPPSCQFTKTGVSLLGSQCTSVAELGLNPARPSGC